MTEFFLPSGILIWIVIILIYRKRSNKFPTAKTALLIAIESLMIPIGIMVSLGAAVVWLEMDFLQYRWVIFLGGIAVFWFAFDQIRNELTRANTRGKPDEKNDEV